MPNLGSGSTPFVPAAAGDVYRLFSSLFAPRKPVGHFLRQGRDVTGSLSPFLPWSLSLQRFAVGFRFICFAFSIPLRFEGVKHKHLFQIYALCMYPLGSPRCLLETAKVLGCTLLSRLLCAASSWGSRYARGTPCSDGHLCGGSLFAPRQP